MRDKPMMGAMPPPTGRAGPGAGRAGPGAGQARPVAGRADLPCDDVPPAPDDPAGRRLPWTSRSRAI
ncbi:hypothetical protein [Micromonospora haikouensis]|uniref:hypothetical protein n=1 Tax=Micromonospora haikouensis TaxID=686309 RepID=UPI003D8BD006